MRRQYTPLYVPCEFCQTPYRTFPSAVGRQKYCSPDCRKQSRQSQCVPAEARFWKHVSKTESCWNWTGARNKTGYGSFGIEKGNIVLAHRFSYELHFAPVPEGMLVCHQCDNPSCIRPDHLFLGTPRENSQDMVNKGRSVKGRPETYERLDRIRQSGDDHFSRRCPEKVLRGERNGASKLTDASVAEIRHRYEEGNISQSALASEFSVSQRTIWRVVINLSYKGKT